ncbi:MAG: hypothetical protein K9J45_17465, partial [Bacteroidales bacterium]|nr:hypothetical protein [Bacteroidales bacterium]
GSTNYWGTYVMHSNPCRPNLIIQSPHPLHDVNTGQQGLYVFQKIDARFFMMSGTHRCNSSSFSSCDGTTKECSPTNSSEAYRISDMAHVVNSIFHISTKVLIQKTTDPYFIQLHGFSHSTGNPYIIMSNGTFVTPTNDKFPAIEASILAQDGTLNASNICIVHIDKPTSGKCSELKAFSNTQGRLINNSSDPCDKDATSTTGRFIHIEQEKTKFRDTQAGWDKIANALANVFAASNASSVTTNPVGNGLYGAGSALSSSGVIPLGNVVTFKAGSSITLTTGFHVLSGATLSVVLGGYGCFPP